MSALEIKFHEAMLNISNRCQQELKGYKPTEFLRMVHESGGIETARYLIMKADASSGYKRLWEEKRLDLTIEATLVENPEFHDKTLFPDIEALLAKATARLKQYDYQPKT